MRAGACQLDITPPVGGEVPGQWLRRIATRVRDPLAVSALALESGGRLACLVSCDVLSLKNRIVAELRGRLGDVLDPAYLLLAATHTHTGPPVCDALGSQSSEDAVRALTDAIEQAVRTACHRLQPARLGWASGHAPGLAFPRRWRMADGSVRMHPPKDSPDLVAPEDEADDTLCVLQVSGADGTPLALGINFACHPICVGSGDFYSADYPGAVRRAVQEKLGPAAVLYLNGPCGDIGPDDIGDRTRSRYGEQALEEMGTALAERARELAATIRGEGDLPLRAATERITVPLRAVPPEALQEAQAWAQGRDLAEVPQTQREIIWRELLLVAEERQRQPALEIEIGGLAIGPGALVALPGEIFTAIGRQIRAASPFAHTALVELANGSYGYVPTAQAFAGGGYETWLCRSSRLAPTAAADLVAAGRRVLGQLAG